MAAQKTPNKQRSRPALPFSGCKLSCATSCNKSLFALPLLLNLLIVTVWMAVAAYAPVAHAQWQVNENARSATGALIRTAYTHNEAGYSLEVYKDTAAAIRLRFSLANGLFGLIKEACPTYQIDNGTPANRSINDAPCLSGDTWAEFILGQINDNQIQSALLLSVLNGNTINFRFRLTNGDYRESTISLAGSKRSMTSVIGENISVRAR